MTDVAAYVPEVLRIMDEELLPIPDNWTKGTDYEVREDGTECYCLRGARVKAVSVLAQRGRSLISGHTAQDLRRAVKDSLLDCITDIAYPVYSETSFNDSGRTTFTDVKKVIKCARENTQCR